MTVCFQEYDQGIEKVLARLSKVWGSKTKPFKTIRSFFEDSAPTMALRENVELSVISDLLSSIENDELVLKVDENFRTEDLISYVSPLLASNSVFYNMLLRIYEIALQRSAGKGEILASLISSDAQKAEKHGDINVSGKNVEMKADTGTIHQKEENKFRIIDKLNLDTFGVTAEQAASKDFFPAYHPLPTLLSDAQGAREFYSKVYRNWGDEQLDTIERVWNETTCPDRRSMELGYLVMLDYVKHKSIDSLLLTKRNKETISAVNISDFSDKQFIFDNVVMKPKKHRGGSTEARPDGHVDIGVKKTTR